MLELVLVKAASNSLYLKVINEGDTRDYAGTTQSIEIWYNFMDVQSFNITFTLDGGDAVSNVFILDDLDSSTDYNLELYLGDDLEYESDGFVTKASSYVDLTPLDLATTRYNDGFTFKFVGCQDATSYEARVTLNGVTKTGTATYPTIRIVGLEPCQQYTVHVRAKNSSKTGSWVFGYPCTVAPPKPIIDSYDVSDREITVVWSLEKEVSKTINVYFRLVNTDTDDIEEEDCIETADSSGTYTFSAVEAGEYRVYMWTGYQASSTVELYCLNGSSEYKAYRSVDVTNERPEDWSWTGNGLSATAAKTKAAHTAVTELTSTHNFSYKVWNDMVTKVGEFLEYKEYYSAKIGTNNFGYSTSTKCSTILAKAKMTASSRNMTATRFNALNCCICKMKSTGISKVAKGNIVRGSYFITLMAKLNAIT